MAACKALITGGAGFVGHHLAKALLDTGWRITVLDNFSSGKPENIAALRDHPRFGLTVTDLTDEKACSEAVESCLPDVVFHLAAVHFIPYCVAHPNETVRVNVTGTQHLLEAARNTPSVKKVVFASSADVYRPQDGPNVEAESPTGGLSIYGVSKLICEALIQHYRETCRGAAFVIARFFNIYGPGETNPHVIPDILKQMKESDMLALGDVTPKRDFVYVTDVADALMALANGSIGSTEVNVASGAEYSVAEMVRTIAELTGRDLKIVQDPARFRAAERMHLLGDITKIHRLAGWRPKYGLREGLAALLAEEGLMPGGWAAGTATARRGR